MPVSTCEWLSDLGQETCDSSWEPEHTAQPFPPPPLPTQSTSPSLPAEQVSTACMSADSQRLRLALATSYNLQPLPPSLSLPSSPHRHCSGVGLCLVPRGGVCGGTFSEDQLNRRGDIEALNKAWSHDGRSDKHSRAVLTKAS